MAKEYENMPPAGLFWQEIYKRDVSCQDTKSAIYRPDM